MQVNREKRHLLQQLVACGAAVAAMLAAPVSAGAETAWDNVVAAAKKEGTLTLYSNLQPNGIEPLLREFQKAYPEIRVEQIRAGAPPLYERFSTEFWAGRHIADVVITFPDQAFLEGIDNENWAMEWTPPELENFPADINRNNELYTLQTSREVLIWNTRAVSDDEAPREWADLFDEKWKGRVGMNPPWRALAIQQVVAFWEDQLNLGDTAQKLKDNNVRFFEGSGGLIQAVVRGDVAVAQLTDLPLNTMLEDGAPLGFHYPESGTTSTNGIAFVPTHAPNPNAGKVFVNWLMTEEGQAQLRDHGGLSVTRTGAAPLKHLPSTESLPNVVDGLSLLDADKQQKIVNHWRTTFGIQ